MKKKSSPKKTNTVAVAPKYHEPKSVRIEKADNGFTVSTYTDSGCKQMVAKSEAEAIRHAKSLLGGNKK